MKIDKVKNTYSEYKVTVSFGQLKALYDALSSDHSGPIKDEIYKALDYYFAKLPLPGEDPEDQKELDKAVKEEEKDKVPKEGDEEPEIDANKINSMEELDKIAPNPPEE